MEALEPRLLLTQMPSGGQVAHQVFVELDHASDLCQHPARKQGPYANPIDVGAPTSAVSPLPEITKAAVFAASAAGQDEPAGPGVAGYDLSVQVEEGPFAYRRSVVPQEAASDTGRYGHANGFFSVAADYVGHREAAPDVAETGTRLEPNHAPIAANNGYPADEGTLLAVASPGVLDNDIDADGDTLTAIKVTDPQHGQLTLNSNGSFTYVPSPGYRGLDSFLYKANDGTADSNTVIVTIRVDPVVLAPPTTTSNNLLLRRTGDNIQLLHPGKRLTLFDQPASTVHKLTIKGVENKADTLTVDFALGGFFVIEDGVVFQGGGGSWTTDTLSVRATAGDDTLVIDTAAVVVNHVPLRFSGTEQVKIDGLAGNDQYQIVDLGAKTIISDTGGIDRLGFSQAAAGVTINMASTYGAAQKVFANNANTLGLKSALEHATGTPWGDFIKGNSAANRIWGDSGNDVLLGEMGNDRLNAGSGRNLLIGGLGEDTLTGSYGEEILIGSMTVWDADDLALAAIMAEWTSTSRTFAQRVTNLENGIVHETLGLIRLKRITSPPDDWTVGEDGARDTLYGSYGSDWFLDFPRDEVRDRGSRDR